MEDKIIYKKRFNEARYSTKLTKSQWNAIANATLKSYNDSENVRDALKGFIPIAKKFKIPIESDSEVFSIIYDLVKRTRIPNQIKSSEQVDELNWALEEDTE